MSFTIVKKSVIRQKDERIRALESELDMKQQTISLLTEEKRILQGSISRLQQVLERYKPRQGKDGKFISKNESK